MAFSLGAMFGGGYESKKSATYNAAPEFVQAPDYAESEGARTKWWDLLQQFGQEPGYGAIQPDWGQIWEDAQNKVKQYYWGSPTDPGVVNKVKSSAAARGVSESPALTKMMARMGASEGNALSSMATEQAKEQANLSEQGRQFYLQNLMGLSNMNPQGTFYTPWSKTKSSGWNVDGQISAEIGV